VTRVAVVGGGLAGIAAALACADRGASVTLLEARGWLGGATFSVERDGLWLDNGQHVFLRCCPAYRGLLRRLGVESDVLLQERLDIPVLAPGRRAGRLRRGDAPAPFQLAAALARYPFLTATEKLRLGPAVAALRRLRPGDPGLDEETFGSWLARHGQGEGALAGLWDLITLPTVNLPARDASLALAAKVFKTGLLEDGSAADVGYATVPLQRLHGDAAARALSAAGVAVRLRAPASAILAEGDGATVVWKGGSATADAVVCAVPHDVVGDLLPAGTLPDGVVPVLLGASPILNLHVVYDRPVTDLPFAAAVGSPVQWVFDRTASSGLASGQLLAVSLSAADGLVERSLAELRTLFLPALVDLFPAARSAEVRSFFATREPRATFRGVPGSARHRSSTVTRNPRIVLAGAWTDTGWPATMEGAVRSGLAAAGAALAAAGPPASRELAA
jgi:squalene-associated FAD-dependent desaturase